MSSNPPEITTAVEGTKQKPPPHPIGASIDAFVHEVRDTLLAARYIVSALKYQLTVLRRLKGRLERALGDLDSEDAQQRIAALRDYEDAHRRSERIRHSDAAGVLSRGLFLGLFSALDAFTGKLLEALYTRRPDLFKSINRVVDFRDLLEAPDLASVRLKVLRDEVEALRRLSYSEQFTDLGKRFDLTLTKFDNWPWFVECAQRRNLMTHCNGIVSEQYIKECSAAGVQESDLPKVGTALELSIPYLVQSCELLIEVGTKLGHTLWRKVLPNEIEAADSHLNELLFSTLRLERWSRARTLGKFAVEQKRFSNDVRHRMMIVNFAQALKWGGETDEVTRCLNSVDWSATSLDFRLAEAVLRDRLDDAAALMRQLGKASDLVEESAYHTWPLFREFRTSTPFLAAYEEIFGYPFAQKVIEDADEAAANAQHQSATLSDSSNAESGSSEPATPPALTTS